MKLFDRLDRNIDYNNSYTIRKSLIILENEFNLAVKNKNVYHARDVLKTTEKIYEKFSSMYRESADYGETMSYMQKVWANRMRQFISYLNKRLENDF